MEAIEFPEQNVVFAKDQPEYLPLPAHRFDDPHGRVTYCWRLNWLERFKVFFSGVLWQQTLTFNSPIQPQKLMVEKPYLPADPGAV